MDVFAVFVWSQWIALLPAVAFGVAGYYRRRPIVWAPGAAWLAYAAYDTTVPLDRDRVCERSRRFGTMPGSAVEVRCADGGRVVSSRRQVSSTGLVTGTGSGVTIIRATCSETPGLGELQINVQ